MCKSEKKERLSENYIKNKKKKAVSTAHMIERVHSNNITINISIEPAISERTHEEGIHVHFVTVSPGGEEVEEELIILLSEYSFNSLH